jgi:hypothetical protein
VRRLLSLLLTVSAVALLSLTLLAGPALATESESHSDTAAETTSGFGTGDWDGLVLAMAVGLIVGAGVFATSDPGGIGHGGHH